MNMLNNEHSSLQNTNGNIKGQNVYINDSISHATGSDAWSACILLDKIIGTGITNNSKCAKNWSL